MQPRQIHELQDCFYKNPVKAVELVKKMLISKDESTFSVWIENEKSNKFDSYCDANWFSDKTNKLFPNWPHFTIFCNTCGVIHSSSLCFTCFMRSSLNTSQLNNDKKEDKDEKQNDISYNDLNIEPHQNHDVYFSYTRNGHCSCGDMNSMDSTFFCPYHALQPSNPPNAEIFGSDHCDFITDLTDICFRSLIIHASHASENVKCIVDFLLELARINTSYLHLVAAAISENFDSSALFTHWPQFQTQNSVLIVKLIETLNVDDSFQYSFSTSFFENYIYLLSYDLNMIDTIGPSTVPTSTVPLLAAADMAWSYYLSHEEMIEDDSTAELIGKEFYILASFVRNDPFHPIISHSFLRNFFKTMKIFFDASDIFFKTLNSAESISKITEIYIDALSLETFPVVTKKYNFYDFKNYKQDFRFFFNSKKYDINTENCRKKSSLNASSSNDDNSNETENDNFASFFNSETDTNSEKADKYSLSRHLILRNWTEEIDPKYQFMRCALKFKKNLFCAIEKLSDLFKNPEVFIMPLLCGMMKTFFSTMSLDQFLFQNEYMPIKKDLSPGQTTQQKLSSSDQKNSEKNTNNSKNNNNNNNNSKVLSTNQSAKKKSGDDDDSVIVNNLLNLQQNDKSFSKKKISNPQKNMLWGMNFTSYYEAKETFFFRSVLDDLTFVTCSAPCHSIAFRKFCKYSTNGIEDWRKALKDSNVYDIIFTNSNCLRNAFKYQENQDIEIDQRVKLYLDDISLLTITVIPLRICALSSLISLGVAKANDKLIKKEIKKKNKSKPKIYGCRYGLVRSVLNERGRMCNLRLNDNNDLDNMIDYEEEEEDYDEYDAMTDQFNDDKNVSNDFYYNLFLKFADFDYDIIGSFSGSICALSFASNIGYLSYVTFCIFDLKNEITSKKLFSYLNFLICCISDRVVYTKNEEKVFYFFIRNLLIKRGAITGSEILKECDSFYTKQDKTQSFDDLSITENYFVNDLNELDQLYDKSNYYEDLFIENKMKGKQVDELDSFELLSGKSHFNLPKIKDRLSRQIINQILNEIAEPVNQYDEINNFNRIVFKIRDEYNGFYPSIFNTAKESFDQWTKLISKYPFDAFLKLSLDNDYKPNGFSPQSVLLTSEFFSILFVSAIEADDFDKETIHIFFSVLNYIKQFSYFIDKNESDAKEIKAADLIELIKLIPSSFSQFQKVPIEYKNHPKTTFNDLLLKFGKIGEIFLKNSNTNIPHNKAEKKKEIFDLFISKRLDYLSPFAKNFNFNKNSKPEHFLLAIPILIFDGFSGRQIWTSSFACDQIAKQLESIENGDKQTVYKIISDQRSNAWIPANLDSSFESLLAMSEEGIKIVHEGKQVSFIDLFINQFGIFDPHKNLFNAVQSTIESIELRLRSNPFAIDDARPRVLLGNAFRILWLFVQKKLKGKKVEKIVINRDFNYRNNNLWSEGSMTNSTVLSSKVNKLTLLLSLLLISPKPSDEFKNILKFVLAIESTNSGFSFDHNGANFIVENFESDIETLPVELNEKVLVKDEYFDLLMLRFAFITAYCCLWNPLEIPASLLDPQSDVAQSDLLSLLLSNEKVKADTNDEIYTCHFFKGIEAFSFVDLPNNFFGFTEIPFAAEMLNNNVMDNENTSIFDPDDTAIYDLNINSEFNLSPGNSLIKDNGKYLASKQMQLIKEKGIKKIEAKNKTFKKPLFACSETVDLVSGEVGDFDSLIAKSDLNCSVLISLSGKDAGICYAYNKSLKIINHRFAHVYLTHFWETGTKSGELLYLNKDRVLKLEDSFLSGELFL